MEKTLVLWEEHWFNCLPQDREHCSLNAIRNELSAEATTEESHNAILGDYLLGALNVGDGWVLRETVALSQHMS